MVRQLVHTVTTWAGPMPPDLPHLESLPERLDGVVHSLLVELEGDGGVDPHRLSPKGSPDVDLFDCGWSFRHSYPPGEEDRAMLPAEAVALLERIQARQQAWQAREGLLLAETIAGFVAAVLGDIQSGFEIVPQFYDEDGEHAGEGGDIAPGLEAAFVEVWRVSAARIAG